MAEPEPPRSASPPRFWRSLEERAAHRTGQAPASQDPSVRDPLALPSSRREFLRLMGASLSLTGSGCLRRPAETIVPYAQAPEKLIPGRPLYYATSVTLGGYATGVLVESHEGRPTKIEGNPDHPASLGATDLFAQAQVLSLYDPDRSRSVLYQGQPATFGMFLDVMEREQGRLRSTKGQGLRLLTETITSPLLGQQLRELLGRLPRARWHQYEPVHRDSFRAGTALAFGEPVDARYQLEAAQLIVSLGADFLSRGPSWVCDARRFIDRRRVAAGTPGMNRLCVMESGLSITGSNADHRLALRPRQILLLARALASALVPPGHGAAPALTDGPLAAWASWLVTELDRRRGASLIIAGEEQPPAVHALCCALNHALGNIGRTVEYTRPAVLDAGLQTASLKELALDMEAGAVSTLLILGGNPAYYAPVDLEFARRLHSVPLRIHLGLYRDETARLCHWHIPEAHLLESWSDARAYDGTVGLVQPLIAPLYDGRSAHELLAVLQQRSERSAYDLLRGFWRAQRDAAGFEAEWAQALQRGVIAGTALPAQEVTLRADGVRAALHGAEARQGGMDLLFHPDPTIWDGRFANNAWLQELPKPMSTLTWENAAQLSPDTARRLDLATGDIVELQYRGRTLAVPVQVCPGHADETVMLALGYGRTAAGQVGNDAGGNAYALRTADEPWIATGVALRRTGRHRPLAVTQRHHSMQGREPVRLSTLAEYLRDPQAPHAQHEEERRKAGLSLFQPRKDEGHKWGMAIDLTACIGCGTCTLACQAENNIPVVGQRQVLAGREMHWIRVDHYYRDSGEVCHPDVVHQPVPCMHCETAPCELVCPVAATVHDHEGLNEMVYNRCVGTRYCSNNCPYKVRRFNYFHYSQPRAPSLRLLQNPDVTVRSRGVMEKCTYCVQRISAARLDAEREERPIRDGEIVPACAQACPTRAIVFGDLNDPTSRVRRYKQSPLNYELLPELNTRPLTSYQARLLNPDPAAPAPPAKKEP